MATSASSTRRRPPDDTFGANKRQRSSARWTWLRKRVQDSRQQLRVLIFVHVQDATQCFGKRLTAVFRWKEIVWKALQHMKTISRDELPDLLHQLNTCAIDATVTVLTALMVHVLRGYCSEYRPLMAQLAPRRRELVEQAFDARHFKSLGPPHDLPRLRSWFPLRTQSNSFVTTRSLRRLACCFPHISTWSKDPGKRLDGVWRTRKYCLYPTMEQRRRLRQCMGTCRWTYNHAVAHFRKTNVYNARTLRDLYVTKTTEKPRVYPEGMTPPPDWAFQAPNSFRYNALRKFQSNIKAAFSNKTIGNIKKFNISFKSRKNSRFFTFCEDAFRAKITRPPGETRAMLSISSLPNIPIRCDPDFVISSEIEIMNINGFWYAAIPQLVRPSISQTTGRAIALDPGLKAFMTGVDLDGNAVHIARGNRAHLDALRTRASDAQKSMSDVKNHMKSTPGHRNGKQWRTFARAKRAFESATAKMKNCIKELHYQTCAFLTKHYDIIVLPIFSSMQMVKKSSKRNHTYDNMLLGLKHYQFRELLRAKCEVKGKTLVVCSEMYTSQTCGRCSRLHLKLGNKDVFDCPHCDHVAGRDVNAAFNILRFTCAGSLSVHAIHR